MLNLINITHQFADKLLYEKLNLQINKGEHVGLIGQNGTGKSTLIKIITGELLPDDGRVEFPKSSHLGYLDQYVRVDEQLSIYDFLKTAFQKDLDVEEQVTAYYTAYATEMDERLLEKSGRLQTQLDQGGFYQMEIRIEEFDGKLKYHYQYFDVNGNPINFDKLEQGIKK